MEAARWLHDAGLLRDSQSSPGLPLRRMAIANKIFGAYKKQNRYWFIKRMPAYREMMSVEDVYPYLDLHHKKSVYTHIRRKKIPHIRLNDQFILFYKDEFFSWLILNNRQEKIDRQNREKFLTTRKHLEAIKQEIK
ncbi:MAG: hypothetical protein GXO78_14680 [Calditrichaeota bacterium]|nr:hypothetical protein [Calditrichota bacterium]